MYDLVADVSKYPEFLPWVMALRVRTQTADEIVADMVVGFKAVRETFTSRVRLDRPNQLKVEYISGPLKYLHNNWTFSPGPNGGTRLGFVVDFEFRSKVFEKLAGLFFQEALRKMVNSFETRAEKLYGKRSRSATSAA